MKKNLDYYYNRWNIPLECPCCDSKLIIDGVDLCCKNPKCSDKLLHQTVDFIKRLDVKFASEATLKKFNIKNIPDLLMFKANPKYKTEVKLESELLAKVFSRSKQELLAAMPFEDLGETLINKIVDFYGYDTIANLDWSIRGSFPPGSGMPSGIGDITLQKFKDSILENLNYVNMFICDSRYSYTQNDLVASETKSDNKNGMSVCFTGKLNTMGRTEAEKKAIAAGFEIKAVNKKLTYLVTNDPDTNSGKGKKARELGIKIISENEFLKMISNQTLAQDVFEL